MWTAREVAPVKFYHMLAQMHLPEILHQLSKCAFLRLKIGHGKCFPQKTVKVIYKLRIFPLAQEPLSSSLPLSLERERV